MKPPVEDRSLSEIVPLRAGQKAPLFCFHVGNFQQMAAAMPEDECVYGLRPINLDIAGAHLSVEYLAASHLREVRKIQERGPYRFIGYSFGGMVAYEMATLLLNSGEEVDLLALVDTLNPHFRYDLSPAEARRFRKTYFADRLKKYSKNLLQGRVDSIGSDAAKLVGKLVRPIAWKVTQTICRALDRPLPAISEAVFFEAMWLAWAPKDFEGRVVLFRVEKAMDAGAELDDDPSMGWSKCAKKGVDIQYLPGDHATVMQMPNVLDLAKKLEPYLCVAGPDAQ
jgi:thioesterase domain-containing protein